MIQNRNLMLSSRYASKKTNKIETRHHEESPAAEKACSVKNAQASLAALEAWAEREHIYRLEIRMQNESELSIDFEGQRARTYVNVAPAIIKTQGTCHLIKGVET